MVNVKLLLFQGDIEPPRLSHFPLSDITINDLELTNLLDHLHLFCAFMAPLSHIRTIVNHTEVQVWYNMGIVSSVSDVGPILHDLTLLTLQRNIYASIGQVKGVEKIWQIPCHVSHTFYTGSSYYVSTSPYLIKILDV